MRNLRMLALTIGLATSTASWGDTAFWAPSPADSFDWVLSEQLPKTLPKANILDLDGFETPASQVQHLHEKGKNLVCYVNVGAWENWRPDKAAFPASVIGNAYPGWPGERFLDIRKIDVLLPLMRDRFRMCAAKGFDSIEPDNLDSHEQPTGFDISREQQVAYAKAIAGAAHDVGLSIALKNVPELAPELLPHYDWMLLEDCFAQGWCKQAEPFTSTGKAVVAVEYTDNKINFQAFCKQARQLGLIGVLKRRELGNWSRTC